MSINLQKRMTTGPKTAFVSCVNLLQQERDITMQEARMITGGNGGTDIVGDVYERHGLNRPITQNGGGVQRRGGGGGGGGRGTGLFEAIGSLFSGSGGSGGSGGSEGSEGSGGSGGSGGEATSEVPDPHNSELGSEVVNGQRFYH